MRYRQAPEPLVHLRRRRKRRSRRRHHSKQAQTIPTRRISLQWHLRSRSSSWMRPLSHHRPLLHSRDARAVLRGRRELITSSIELVTLIVYGIIPVSKNNNKKPKKYPKYKSKKRISGNQREGERLEWCILELGVRERVLGNERKKGKSLSLCRLNFSLDVCCAHWDHQRYVSFNQCKEAA